MTRLVIEVLLLTTYICHANKRELIVPNHDWMPKSEKTIFKFPFKPAELGMITSITNT
jgi:hypothetical protein